MHREGSRVPFQIVGGTERGEPGSSVPPVPSKPSPSKPPRGRPHLVDPPGLAELTFPHDPNHPINRLPTQAERALSFDPAAQTGPTGPADLLVAAVDDKGHSAVIPAIRVPPIMHYQITRIVQSGKYPWKTTSDLVRWAIVEGLTKLSHLSADGLLSDANARMRAMLEVLAAEQVYSDFGELIERSRKAVQELEGHGYGQRAEQVIRNLASEIASIRDDDWRRDLEAQFRRQFREYLQRLGLTKKPSKLPSKLPSKSLKRKKVNRG